MMQRVFTLFGKPIQIKRYGCRMGNALAMPIPPCVNLFVKATNRCNASCAFCSNAARRHDKLNFNVDKLFRCIDEILGQHILLNRLNITGGEPSLATNIVGEIIQKLEREQRYRQIHLHLNTNGVQEASHRLMIHHRWDSISVSMHHYDMAKLAEIYGLPVVAPSIALEGVDMNKVNLSCNLIKGYIDSPSEAHKMLDFALDMEVMRIGFVGLMPMNDYCRQHFVDLEDIRIDTIPHVYFTKSKNRGKECKCSNYLYNKDTRILEIYMRNYMNPAYCESSLLFDGEYLRQGFNDDNIIC